MRAILTNIKAAVPRGLKRLARRIVFDAGGDYHDAYFIAGTHRSGTTWLSKIIDYDLRMRDMYEPFNAERGPEAGSFTYGFDLRPDEPGPEYLETARRILARKIIHPFVANTNPPVILPQPRIIAAP